MLRPDARAVGPYICGVINGVEVTQKNRNVLTDIPIFYLLSFIIK